MFQYQTLNDLLLTESFFVPILPVQRDNSNDRNQVVLSYLKIIKLLKLKR